MNRQLVTSLKKGGSEQKKKAIRVEKGEVSPKVRGFYGKV